MVHALASPVLAHLCVADMLTLDVPLSWEVGEDLPKVREFWWELSLGPYRGKGAEFIRLAARSLIKGSLGSDLNQIFWTPQRQTPSVYDATPLSC